MGVEELPSSGNKFTGSRMIVPGVGLNTYRVQKNDKFSIRRNPFANSINASPTPTPSVTPTTSPIPLNQFVFDAIGLNSISFSMTVTSTGGYVDWGDGNTSPITSLSSANSHTYSTTYTGQITIYYYGNITLFNLSNTSPNSSSVTEVDTQEISNLSLLTSLTINYGRLVGQMSDLTSLSNLTNLIVKYDYTTSPNLNEIPTSIQQLIIGSGGYTTITGDISVISSTTIQEFSIRGSNTVYGDISTLPNSVTTINVTGSNTLSGNTSDFNFPNLTYLFLQGSNTVTGDVVNLPNTITSLYMYGNNTIYGSLSDIPASINILNLTTTGILTGDLSDLPRNGYSQLTLNGSNSSLSADTSTIPIVSGVTFNVTIEGSLTGDLSDLFNGGVDFPSCTFILNASNASSCSITYTSGVFLWGSLSATQIGISTSTNLTNTEIDNLLIDIDSFGGGVDWISCAGGSNGLTLNGVRTSASNAAVTSLNGKGVTVTVLP